MPKKKLVESARSNRPATRVATPVPSGAPPRAHPRLVYGFLVVLAGRPPSTTGAAKPSAGASVPANGRGARPAACKREGPGDDAIFH